MELADIKREIEVVLEHTDLKELSEFMGCDQAHFQSQLEHVLTGEYLGVKPSNDDSNYAFLFKLLSKLNLDDEFTPQVVQQAVKQKKDRVHHYEYDDGAYVNAVWDESKVAPEMIISGMSRMGLSSLRLHIPMEVALKEEDSALEKWMKEMIPEHYKKNTEKFSGHGEISHYVYERSATETFLFNSEGNQIEKITIDNVS
jgi:hypothetical protein